MVSSKAFFVSFLVSCVLLSVYCQKAEEQGLPGIRWGRHFQKDDLTQRGGEGKLWRVMEQKRNHRYRLNGKTCKDVKEDVKKQQFWSLPLNLINLYLFNRVKPDNFTFIVQFSYQK